MTDAELDLAYRSRGSLPPAERAAIERAHAEMVARYNSEWGTPDNVAANLDAAASPLPPDPAVDAPARKPAIPQQAEPPPTKWQELMADRRNFSLEEADQIAAESDPGMQGLMERAPNRYERFGREMNELDARLGWERGHPAKEPPYPDLVPGANALTPPASAKPAGPPVEMIGGKPFVNIDGAFYPASSSIAADPGEYEPSDHGYGTMLVDGLQVPIAIPADPLMNRPAQYRLGDVEKERRRSADHANAVSIRKRSIEENRRFGSPYLPPDKWTPEQASARVARKQSEVRQANMGYAHNQRIRSLADALGVSEDVAAAAYEAEMAKIDDTTQMDVPPLGSTPPSPGQRRPGSYYSPGQLRESQDMLTPAGIGHVMQQAKRAILADASRNGAVDRRQAQKEYAREAVIRRAQAKQNPLEYLGREDINDWQRMAMAEQFLRQPQSVTPLSVQAANNAQLTQLGLRVATGQGFQQPLPEQRERLRQQIDSEKPVQIRAQEQAAAGRLNHTDVMQHANSIVDRLYSRATFMGNTSDFTDNEVDLATQKLADDLGVDYEAAKPIMQRIQEERRQNMLASGIVASVYDR